MGEIKGITVLDQGYVKHIESWGRGEAGVLEAGIIEAARQSTQGSFRGWDVWHCGACGNNFTEKFDHDLKGYRMIRPDDERMIKPCEKPQWSNDEKLLGFLYNNKPPHSTPFEFCGMTIEVQAPIFVLREWHRHRTQSYNEMSARYSPLPDLKYVPSMERLFMTQVKNKQAQAAVGAVELTNDSATEWLDELQQVYMILQETYERGLAIGVPKEVARVCLPVGQYSRMRATANLRNWLGFLTLRMHPDAQWEIRQFANAVGLIIKDQFPKTWDLFDGSRPK